MACAGSLTFLFLIICCTNLGEGKDTPRLVSIIEDKLEIKLGDYAKSLASWLEGFNDGHLGKSELGRLLHYDEIKPRLDDSGKQGRGMKKVGMALLPLIFHVGATSTWMLLTTLLAAKSVAIGLALLVFKIAVSSAKVASFFTALKGKHHDDGWSWSPHHHGHYRSFTDEAHPAFLEHGAHSDNSYIPEWTPADSPYSTIAKEAIQPYDYADKKAN
ncbi:hypothetical protein ACJJTC_017415 [Scirpophaga incertulas]